MKRPTHSVVVSSVLGRLLHDHQIFCTADCCKDMAFQFTEGSIARWLDSERVDRMAEIASEIESVRSRLQCVSGSVYLSVRGLESEWGADEFRAFWDRLGMVFDSAVKARRRSFA